MHTRHPFLILLVLFITLFITGCAPGEPLLTKPTPTPVLTAAPPANAQPGDMWISTVAPGAHPGM